MTHHLQRKLTIGLIVDSTIVGRDVYELVEWSKQQDNMTISHLVIQTNTRRQRRLIARICHTVTQHGIGDLANGIAFAILLGVENRRLARFAGYGDHLTRHDISKRVGNSIVISPQVSNSGCVYRYSDNDVDNIKTLKLDVLISVGSGILRGDILNAARLGILSSHHGDNRIKRAAPGFWEVYYRRNTTGVTIHTLTEELDDGDVLFRGRFPTKVFYLLNQAFMYKKSNFYMMRLLSKIAETGRLEPIVSTRPYFIELYKRPTVAESIAYAVKQSRLLSTKLINRWLLNKQPRWGVAFKHGGWQTLVMSRATRIKNPPYRYLADPFVVERNGRTVCYVEDYDYKANKGCISAYELMGSSYQRLGEVIAEPFHMSFPYLFEHNGDLYMCPETSANRDIRLYKCSDFPLKWELSTIVMSNISAADTMIFEKDGLWWLLTTIDPASSDDLCSELNIFHSSNPLSTDWTPHAGNPVIVDANKARNAGLLVEQDAIYRVAQRQGFDMYGKAFSINKVTLLSTQEYGEEESGSVEPHFYPNLIGTHHLHSNGKATVFDYCTLSRVTN